MPLLGTVLASRVRELIMTTPIAALHPPDQSIRYKPEYDGAPDTPDIAFSDLWQDKNDGLSFGDFLDIINPLQHIPVISTKSPKLSPSPAGSVDPL